MSFRANWPIWRRGCKMLTTWGILRSTASNQTGSRYSLKWQGSFSSAFPNIEMRYMRRRRIRRCDFWLWSSWMIKLFPKASAQIKRSPKPQRLISYCKSFVPKFTRNSLASKTGIIEHSLQSRAKSRYISSPKMNLKMSTWWLIMKKPSPNIWPHRDPRTRKTLCQLWKRRQAGAICRWSTAAWARNRPRTWTPSRRGLRQPRHRSE